MLETRAGLPAMLVATLLVAGCASAPVVPEGAKPALLMKTAAELRQRGDLKNARKLYDRVVSEDPAAPQAKQAEWLAAGVSEQMGELAAAAKEYEDFHSHHPLDHLGDLEDRLYTIGTRQYNEGRSGILGLGVFTTWEEGITTLSWISDQLPHGNRADDALMFIAKARWNQREYSESADRLKQLLDRYPQSEWALQARLLLGKVYMGINRGAAYDRSALLKARTAFRDYIQAVQKVPSGSEEYAARIKEAKGGIATIERLLADKDVLIARFYLSQQRNEAAKIYLEGAVRDYRSTPAGQEAERMLEKMKAGPPPEKASGPPAKSSSKGKTEAK